MIFVLEKLICGLDLFNLGLYAPGPGEESLRCLIRYALPILPIVDSEDPTTGFIWL